jgi:effector-binding domain-containing protein
MLSEPKIVQREARPYVGIRETVPMNEIAGFADRGISGLFGWLNQHGLKPAGAPFFRYYAMDESQRLDMEAGVPVAAAATGDERVHAGTAPAGRYATLTHTGHYDGLRDANMTLQHWVEQQGLSLKMDGTRWGGRFEIYQTDPSAEPDQSKWETEVAFQLADG